jgi:hypothetical protein
MNMNIIPGAFQFKLALTKVMITKIRLNPYPLSYLTINKPLNNRLT